MEQSIKSQNIITDAKARLSDVLLAVSWREIARAYFQKSSSWMYHKMDGIDGNGGRSGFTRDEALQLKEALCDLADRLRRAADKLEVS